MKLTDGTMEKYLHKIEMGLCGALHVDLETAWKKLETHCESPIEIALALSLRYLDRIDPIPYGPLILSSTEDIERYGKDARLLVLQYKIENKRIDFLFRDPPVQVFIECDGHDFHERTKEQAARDRQRDRSLQQTGTPILRFTGSEIFADPLGCAHQVFDFVGDLHMNQSLSRTA